MNSRALFLLSFALLLNACSSLSEKSNSPLAGSNKTILGETAPGIEDMFAPSKAEKEDDAWWDHYYGHKSSGD